MFNQTQTLFIKGKLTPELMLSGIQLLQKKQVVLQVGLHENHGTLYFHQFKEPEKYIRYNIVKRESDEHWKKLHSYICNHSPPCMIDGKDLLLWEVQFLYNENEDNHELILSSCHGIIDGFSRVLFAQQLVQCLEKVVEKSKDDLKSYEFPKSQEELCFTDNLEFSQYRPFSTYILPDFLRGIFFLLLFNNKKPDILPLDKRVPKEEREDAFLYEHIDEKNMEIILNYCKDQKISFHSLLCSIVVLSAKKVWNLKEGFKLGLSIPVGLRQYLIGKVDFNQMGSMNSFIDILVPIKNDSLERLSCKIQEEIKKDLIAKASKNMFQFSAITSIVKLFYKKMLNDRTNEARSNQISISNVGKVKSPEGKNFKIEGLVAQACNTYYGSNFSLSLVSFNNDCWITFSYPKPLVSDETAKDIVNNFKSILKTIY